MVLSEGTHRLKFRGKMSSHNKTVVYFFKNHGIFGGRQSEEAIEGENLQNEIFVFSCMFRTGPWKEKKHISNLFENANNNVGH